MTCFKGQCGVQVHCHEQQLQLVQCIGVASRRHLLCDCMRGLDDLRCNPGESPSLRRDIADICIPLLLGQAKVCNLADCTPVFVPQQQVGTLQVKVHNPLGVQVLHSLQVTP